jgi:uncharacterized membrane protein YedE/YeeE
MSPVKSEEQTSLLDWRIAAVALGVLMTAATALWRPLGVSMSYVTTWGIALRHVVPGWAQSSPYLKLAGTTVNAEWMLVLGVVVGGLIAATVSRSRRRQAVPAMWAEQFGPSSGKRFVAAFVGGFFLLFGARLAGGCTSGHVMSGLSQLALSSTLFAAAVFASGILTARLLYRRSK